MELNIGSYVRTTYGIGKITDMNIIYSNDGAFWHISCLTNMYINNRGYIEVGLYAEKETYGEDGDFLRVYNSNERFNLFEDYNSSVHKTKIDNYLKERGIEYVCYINYGKSRKAHGNSGLYDDHKFIKASNNIIDLIEVGDYVNGTRVSCIYEIGDLCYGSLSYKFKEKTIEVENDNYETIPHEALFTNNEIESITTKEQFSSMEYKVSNE